MSSVLDRDGEHFTFCQDLAGIAAAANIKTSVLETSMRTVCTDEEVEYVLNLPSRKQVMAGLVYIGYDNAEVRMMGVCGALVRNFIDARMMVLQDLLAGVKNNSTDWPDVILVPNFCEGAVDKGVADWQSNHLLGWLTDRWLTGRSTFLSVTSMNHVKATMGTSIFNFIEKNYDTI